MAIAKTATATSTRATVLAETLLVVFTGGGGGGTLAYNCFQSSDSVTIFSSIQDVFLSVWPSD